MAWHTGAHGRWSGRHWRTSLGRLGSQLHKDLRTSIISPTSKKLFLLGPFLTRDASCGGLCAEHPSCGRKQDQRDKGALHTSQTSSKPSNILLFAKKTGFQTAKSS